MNLKEILTDGGGLLLVLMTLVQIAPIKADPWSWIARGIGNAVNGSVIDKVEKLSNDVQALRNECEEREATACRTRILRFGDEILHNVHHSKEHFDQILIDITAYENYCASHPDFRNNVAAATIKRINQVYARCIRDNDFLE